MRNSVFLLFFAIAFVSCKEDKGLDRKLPSVIEAPSIVKKVKNPSTENSQLPKLFSNGTDLYFSWVTRKDSSDHLSFSVLHNSEWSETYPIVHGSDWFTNWADFPAIAENNGTVLTNILQKSASGTYTYDIKLNISSSQGKTFKDYILLHDDGTKSEHGFVSMKPYTEESFYVTWLDGRNTSGSHDSHDDHTTGGAMTLRAAKVYHNGEISNDTELDTRVCDCCNTAMTVTNNGPIIAYRDRSDDEVRDISIVRMLNGKWTTPKTIGKDHWKIDGCPVNGPAIDSFEKTVVLSWYTANKDEGDIKVAFSMDEGETFGTPFRIDRGDATGRVNVVALDDKEAAVLWMQPNGDEEELLLMKINHHGYTEPPIAISKMSGERMSGFPQLEKVGDRLYIAWTDVSKESTSIKMASVLITDL